MCAPTLSFTHRVFLDFSTSCDGTLIGTMCLGSLCLRVAARRCVVSLCTATCACPAPERDHESPFGFPLKKGTVFQNLTATVSIRHGLAHRILPPATARGSGSTQWVETATGDCKGQIVLEPVDYPNDRVRIGFKLTKDPNGQSGRLTLTFNPAAMLAGPDTHPTLVNAKTGKAMTSPSSAPSVIDRLLGLGFHILEVVYQLLPGKKGKLFADDTWAAIMRGDIRIRRAQWDAYLTTRDRDKFLRLMTIMFAQPMASGKGVIELAGHLRLAFKYRTHPETHEVTGVALKKLQGKKPLYSLTFSNKVLRVGQVSQK